MCNGDVVSHDFTVVDFLGQPTGRQHQTQCVVVFVSLTQICTVLLQCCAK